MDRKGSTVKTMPSVIRRRSDGSGQVAISLGSSCSDRPMPWLAQIGDEGVAVLARELADRIADRGKRLAWLDCFKPTHIARLPSAAEPVDLVLTAARERTPPYRRRARPFRGNVDIDEIRPGWITRRPGNAWAISSLKLMQVAPGKS